MGNGYVPVALWVKNMRFATPVHPHIQPIKRWIITIVPIQIHHHASKCGVKTLDLEV
ncbi:MAG: hypothetical protein K2J48_03980 [Muribaculaceae bacterium]|nr:hypothetical protein [Muribaculaceae bacterium]